VSENRYGVEGPQNLWPGYIPGPIEQRQMQYGFDGRWASHETNGGPQHPTPPAPAAGGSLPHQDWWTTRPFTTSDGHHNGPSPDPMGFRPIVLSSDRTMQ
jgi:hypothetical protein